VQEIFNDINLDIWKMGWGRPPVALLPSVLCRLWRDEALPEWLQAEAGLPRGCTIQGLGKGYWKTAHGVTSRIEHYVTYLVQTRAKAISSLRCFERTWPRGLRPQMIHFSVRSTNVLQELDFFSEPQSLMQATFGQLLEVSGLGAKSLIEITTLIESAMDAHEYLTTEVAMNFQIETATTPESSGELAEAKITLLRDVLEQPWAGELSEQDPRFQTLLPAGRGSLEERIERVMSDPATASSDTLALLARLPLFRETVERLNSQFLEDSLIELLAAAIGDSQPRLDAVAARFGWYGEAPKTLQESADIMGVTRERLRQIEQKALERLPKGAVLLPKLDVALSLLEAVAPMSVHDAAMVMKKRGISQRPFSPISILQTAELLGRKTPVVVRIIKGQQVLISESSRNEFGSIVRLARKLAGQAGVASLFQLLDRYGESVEAKGSTAAKARSVTEDDLRRFLSGDKKCEFLNEDWFWFPDIPEGRNRLVNIAKKMLSVVSPQTISSIREGTRRAFRYRASTNPRYRSLVTPPHAVMSAFFLRHPDFQLVEDTLDCLTPLDYRAFLGDGEQVLVEVLRSSSIGVLDRKALIDGSKTRGLNENTLAVYTTYSPILEHIGLDLWKLRGVRVDPAAVEAVREQNQLRTRQTRLLEYGWTPDGRLWIAWKLPGTLNTPVLSVPGAVRRYLCNRTFAAINKDVGKNIGQASVNEAGTSYGYGPFLRHAGADEGDTLLAEFDLAKAEVYLSMVDSIVLEED
jgi:Sigma-70, region 4